jgi:hypothetical protein
VQHKIFNPTSNNFIIKLLKHNQTKTLSSILLSQCTLGWTLYVVSQDHLTKPLANFSIRLPNDWGMPLGWATTFVPFAIVIAGLLFNMLWMSRGIPFKMVI